MLSNKLSKGSKPWEKIGILKTMSAGRPINCEPNEWVTVGKEGQGSERMTFFSAKGKKDVVAKRTLRPRGGGEEIRTLAPAKPTYRISNPDPSTTWVHLQMLEVSSSILQTAIYP